jgi:hypothetical protein
MTFGIQHLLPFPIPGIFIRSSPTQRGFPNPGAFRNLEAALTMTDRYVHGVSGGLESIKKLDKAGKPETIRNLELVSHEA